MKFLSLKEDIPSEGYWDHALIIDIINKTPYADLDNIIILPARQHKDCIDLLNAELAKYEWVLLILTGDEENVFPIEKIKHDRILVYQMTPHIGSKADRFIPNGYPTHRQTNQIRIGTKDLDVFFSGQETHKKRRDCVKYGKEIDNSLVVGTEGFGQGDFTNEQFISTMARAKVALCPSGAVMQDSFRLYEALESGAFPIVDKFGNTVRNEGYWEMLFQKPKFHQVDNWKDIKIEVQYFLDVFPRSNNKSLSWWLGYKRELKNQIIEDVEYLSGLKSEGDITVLMPTSPIKLNPSTVVIEETLRTIRERLPNAEIIIMIDGIREENKDMEQNYEEYIFNLLNICREDGNILPLIFETHSHQAKMTRKALEYVKTPTILFVEHDAPLCNEIPFNKLINNVKNKEANMIRLHHEALILDVHKHLMLDKEPVMVNEVPMIRTSQWSQRPHIASTEFYRDMLNRYFTYEAITMIEDCIHGFVAQAYVERGVAGWREFKTWIYAPDGDMKRSYHLDARGDMSKFENTFKF